jgi:hypothetical protein
MLISPYILIPKSVTAPVEYSTGQGDYSEQKAKAICSAAERSERHCICTLAPLTVQADPCHV